MEIWEIPDVGRVYKGNLMQSVPLHPSIYVIERVIPAAKESSIKTMVPTKLG